MVPRILEVALKWEREGDMEKAEGLDLDSNLSGEEKEGNLRDQGKAHPKKDGK